MHFFGVSCLESFSLSVSLAFLEVLLVFIYAFTTLKLSFLSPSINLLVLISSLCRFLAM